MGERHVGNIHGKYHGTDRNQMGLHGIVWDETGLPGTIPPRHSIGNGV